MQFKDVVGHGETKKILVKEVKNDRISHAQMFIGKEGSGKLPLAIAFAQYLLCDNPGEDDSCGTCPHCLMNSSLTHPDLHFAFPIVVSKTNKVQISDDRLQEWTDIVLNKKYFGLNQWQQHLDELGKRAIITIYESQDILRKLSLKTYGGKYKIMLIWMPEKMNIQTANKLLKLLEEPPEKTLFLLVSDNTENIPPTILSRTQFLRVKPYNLKEVEDYLVQEKAIDANIAQSISAICQGNINEAVATANGDNSQHTYFELFVKLMRAAFVANPIQLMEVSDAINLLDKENQKGFILYGLHVFRESIILNYMKGELVNLRNEERAFLDKFARFINNQNISELMDEFNQAHYHLERNANPKILFSDLVIRLTKLIKKGV